jgi:predicted NACHT family NTPase
MKKISYILILCTLLLGQGQAQEDSSVHTSMAKAIQADVSLSEAASNSAMQVSQIHDQARTKLLVILIQQNDEIIQLLRELKNKKIKGFIF